MQRLYSAKNPEYRKYIQSDEWKQRRNARLALDGYKCQVCGREATEVHHLTYDNFRREEMPDLVSLCTRCHMKAEEIYDPRFTPWAMEEKKTEGNNFMAAMRADAKAIAPIVFEYLKEVCGDGFSNMMVWRTPEDKDKKLYWGRLQKAVNALCLKRYSLNCVEDRRDMMSATAINHVAVVCLQQIKHDITNSCQADLHEHAMAAWADNKTQDKAAAALGITKGTFAKLRSDDGISFGPSLRETVLYYCALDAAAGIRPLDGFDCLTSEDYERLNGLADYMVAVSGTGYFRGEDFKGD